MNTDEQNKRDFWKGQAKSLHRTMLGLPETSIERLVATKFYLSAKHAADRLDELVGLRQLFPYPFYVAQAKNIMDEFGIKE